MTNTDHKKDLEQLVVRLERNHQSVLRLSRALNSYKYEPKDYDCFVKLRDLKAAFEELAASQMDLFDEIQHQELKYTLAHKKVEQSIKEYQYLETASATYLQEKSTLK